MKKIFFIITVLFSLAASGQKVLNGIITNGSSDTYPTHYDSLGKGGFTVVADVTARNAITTARRKIGMMVYSVGDLAFYQLIGGITNSDWVTVTIGGGTQTFQQTLTTGSTLTTGNTINAASHNFSFINVIDFNVSANNIFLDAPVVNFSQLSKGVMQLNSTGDALSSFTINVPIADTFIVKNTGGYMQIGNDAGFFNNIKAFSAKDTNQLTLNAFRSIFKKKYDNGSQHTLSEIISEADSSYYNTYLEGSSVTGSQSFVRMVKSVAFGDNLIIGFNQFKDSNFHSQRMIMDQTGTTITGTKFEFLSGNNVMHADPDDFDSYLENNVTAYKFSEIYNFVRDGNALAAIQAAYASSFASVETISSSSDVAILMSVTGGAQWRVQGLHSVSGAAMKVVAIDTTNGEINYMDPSGGGGSYTFNSPLSETGGAVSIANAAADGSTKGAATFTAADFNSSSAVISIDYSNGQTATGSVKGFLTAADWTTFNSKISGSLTSGRIAVSSGSASLTDYSSFTYDNSTATQTIFGSGNTATIILQGFSGTYFTSITNTAAGNGDFIIDNNGNSTANQSVKIRINGNDMLTMKGNGEVKFPLGLSGTTSNRLTGINATTGAFESINVSTGLTFSGNVLSLNSSIYNEINNNYYQVATFSGDGVSTTFTMTASGTVTWANGQAESNDAATGVIRRVERSGSNITFHFVTAPASGTNNVTIDVHYRL